MFDGRTFASIDEGVAHAEKVGFDEIIARAARVAAVLPPDLVYIGFSLGVLPAQQLAQARPGARGAVLLHGGVPTSHFGTPWPVGLPLQMHVMDGDPWSELDVAQALDAEMKTAELFVYPGTAHLFTDSSLAEYDRTAGNAVLDRVRSFLAISTGPDPAEA